MGPAVAHREATHGQQCTCRGHSDHAVQAAAEDDGRAHGAARVCELAGSRRFPVWLSGARGACTWQPLDWHAHVNRDYQVLGCGGRGGGEAGGYGPNAFAYWELLSSAA
eukprot:scaffold32258_cov54-Phaeocystis_antarctica.AAC.4